MSIRLGVTSVAIFVSALGAASGHVTADVRCAPKSRLSNLDYMALASMADSMRPLAMAAYRPQPVESHAPDAPRAN